MRESGVRFFVDFLAREDAVGWSMRDCEGISSRGRFDWRTSGKWDNRLDVLSGARLEVEGHGVAEWRDGPPGYVRAGEYCVWLLARPREGNCDLCDIADACEEVWGVRFA
jgi:hypothetical protein